MTSADLLAKAGRALYGQQWQSALARDLGVSDRTMRRWVAGQAAITSGVLDDVSKLLAVRQLEMRALQKRIAAVD